MLRRLLQLSLVLCLIALPAAGTPPEHAEDPLDSGPTHLLIFYRVPPANRAAFRRIMSTAGVARLRMLQKQGVFTSDKLYFSRYAESDSWDMVLSLDFARYADVARWNRVETETPGGLPAAAMALTSAVSTYPADVIAARTAEGYTEKDPHVILVVPYTVVVPIPEYDRYAVGYVQPQMDGWMAAGILSRYELAVGRGAAGKPYSAVLLLEYKDDESFGRRDRVLAETRAKLAGNAAWKAYADSKQTIRTERPAIVADELR